jgi:hypothetical protein
LALFTNHLVAHRNENLFFWNPAVFALLPLGVMLMRNSPRAKGWLFNTWALLGGLSVLGVAVKVLPNFHQANWNIIAVLAPLNLGMAALDVLQRRHDRRQKL